MQKYEIMVILPNTQDAKAAETSYKSLNKRLADEFGAKVTFEDFWGERGFAYTINKQKWGYYAVSQFDMEPAKAQELRHELNLDNDIVRFLLTKVDPRSGEPRKYAEVQKEYAAQSKKKSEAKDAKPAPGKKAKLTTVKDVSGEANAKTEEPKAEAPAKDAVDKKLDAIIDASSTDL